MPWTVDTVPNSVKNKSLHLRKIFSEVANKSLSNGHSEEDAVFAGLAAVSNEEHKNKPKSLKKEEKPAPLHLKVLLDAKSESLKVAQEDSSKIAKAFLPNNSIDADSSRSIVSVDWDKTGRLVITFDDGETIVTGKVPVAEHIEQNVAVQVNPVFDYIRFDTSATPPPQEPGLLFWDDEEKALSYYNDSGDITLNIGQEQVTRIYNNTGSSLVDGQIVYINGGFQGFPTVALARADSLATSDSVLGVVTHIIENNTFGYITTNGSVHDLNTSAYPEGTLLYLSETTSGALTHIAPLQPNYDISVGYVTSSDTLHGKIYIHIDKKDWFPSVELLNTSTSVVLPITPTVFKAPTVQYNDGFQYDSSTGELTVLNSGTYGISITFNASPSASNKNIYFYAEEYNGSTWQVNRYTARQLQLINAQETQLLIAANRYYKQGSKIRLYIWGDSTITLKTTDLPGTTPGTISLPAFRFNMA